MRLPRTWPELMSGSFALAFCPVPSRPTTQAEVVEAQLAVQRYRAGLVDHVEDGRPTANEEEPPPRPPLETEGNPGVLVATGGGGESDPEGVGLEAAVGSRKTEEAEALASQLQIIAMHLVRHVVSGEEGLHVALRGRGSWGGGA